MRPNLTTKPVARAFRVMERHATAIRRVTEVQRTVARLAQPIAATLRAVGDATEISDGEG